MQVVFKIGINGDFPGGPVVKNPPYNAGDVASIPGRRTRIPHVVGQLSPCATTTELTRSGTGATQLQSPHALKPVRHNEREAHNTTRIPRAQLRPDAAKKNFF